MMDNEKLQILKLLIENKSTKYSIRKISILRKINYKSAYEAIKKLNKEGVINLEKNGNTSLCSFNNQFNNSTYIVEIYRRDYFTKNKKFKAIYNVLNGINEFFIAVLYGSYVKKTSMDDLIGARVVLTTYGMISNRKTKKMKHYHSILWDVEWNRIVYDEAHHMRNTSSNTYKGAKKMKGDIKWMVTGTPIQNVNKDLKALMYLLDISWGYANDRWDERVVNKYILKRSKVKVGIKMPPIHDYYIDVPIKDEEEYRLVSNLHY